MKSLRLTTAEPSQLGIGDLLSEATAGLVQRPARSALTMLGTLLSVAAFVSVLGLTTTAGNQIDQSFNALTATTVSVTDAASGPAHTRISFPTNADGVIDRLNGSVAAGISFTPPINNLRLSSTPPFGGATADDDDNGSDLSVTAVDPGLFTAIDGTITAGRIWDAFAQDRGEPVAVLGSDAAQELGVADVSSQPVVFINNSAFTVIGILSDPQRDPQLAASVMIPTSTALHDFGPPTDPRATMLIVTRLGAAQLIARQAPEALRPDDPKLFTVVAPSSPTQLKGHVNTALSGLFLVLAAIIFIIGGVGIANTTLVSVLERTNEIGLRRSLGARPRHIAAQFLCESGAIGAFGGVLGTAIGVAVTVLTAVVEKWTPVVAPWTVLIAPLLGIMAGILAGAYPAARAAQIEPVDALRR